VLRRGDELFSLARAEAAAPRKLVRTPAVEHTQIFAGVVVDRRCWLLLNSPRAVPSVLDAYSGTAVSLEIPGLKVSGTRTPQIGAAVLLPHARAAILSLGRGDRATWPRPENRPVYFWVDLRTGKAERLPIGWDLGYFSADERVAVFATPPRDRTGRHILQAVDMTTGKRTDMLPDRRKESCVPYDWTDRQSVKALYAHREGQGDTDYFAGLSVGGRVLPVDLGLEDARFLAKARVRDGFSGFRLRRSGASKAEVSPLWVMPLSEPRKADVVATDVTDFALLGKGNVVYVTEASRRQQPSDDRRQAAAFFSARADKSSWNVLDGVERLPPLPKALANNDVITDRMMMQLVEGTGSGQHEPLALCLCAHYRGDLRALIRGQERVLEPVTWRRALLIGHDGRRCLTPLFREDRQPDQIWLHNSGSVLTGTYVWEEGAAERKRQVRLSECAVQMR
jgi:hypothetical protein